ncbi:DUF2490 domain-containing protein [Alteriqipengyuania lutimaris]|uniref:DUF2490 domain-containing protein n=1 Tax=Alteriqipengyuania lutimaris TaxID=1538146 RepID=A0A395LHL7_9SPHN|nr:DUF2490 domain-containing protein [Alteriqipengyuania lutimaris]
MRSMSPRARVLPLAAVPLLLQPSAAFADDSEFWIELSAKGDIAPGTALKLEVEQRRKAGPGEYIVGAVVDRDMGDGFTIGGGMEVHDTGGFTEIRPYQQVGYSTGILSLRTRIEERFYDESDRMALRLRQRIQLSDDVAPKLKAAGSVELLYQLRDRNDGGPQRIDQWRFNAGLTYRAAERLEVTGGYLLQLRPRPGGDTYTHVPQASLAYRF